MMRSEESNVDSGVKYTMNVNHKEPTALFLTITF